MKEIFKLTTLFVKLVKKATTIYHHKNFIECVEKHKFEDDDVTNLDILTQQYIIKESKKIIPNLSIIGEEGQNQNDSDYEIIIDPIDGTVNFKNNIATHGTQLCIRKNKQPIISVLYLPEFNDMYYANEYGAFKNGKKISISSVDKLKDAIVAVGDFSKSNLKLWQKNNLILTENVKRIRMFGSSCFDSCMLASGNISAYIIYSENCWDILPGQYLMEKAGATIYQNTENNFYIYGSKQVVEMLKNILN